MDQHASILLCTDCFNGPPSEIQLNPKLFRGLYKVDNPSGKGCDDPVSTYDSTSTPSLVPPPATPSLGSPLSIDMGT